MRIYRLTILVVLLFSGCAGKADLDSHVHLTDLNSKRSGALIGVWSNKRNEFAEANIMFFESGRGIIFASLAAGYFKWELLENGEISLHLFAKSPPHITMFFDKANQSVVLRGGSNEEVFKKTDKPIEEDPIATALEEENRSALNWKKKFDIHTETHIKIERVKELYTEEKNKTGDFDYRVYFPRYPDKCVICFSRNNRKIILLLHISEALDEGLPNRVRARISDHPGASEVTIPKKTFISNKDEDIAKSFFIDNVIEYTSLYEKYDYMNGYEIGFRNSLRVVLDEKNVDMVIEKVLTILVKGQDLVNVEMDRKRNP